MLCLLICGGGLTQRPWGPTTAASSSWNGCYCPSFCSWTVEGVSQVLITKSEVLGESGQRGTVPWISCCAVI